MNRKYLLISSIVLLLAIPCVAHAQAWTGVIAPARAIDWSNAGIPGGIPSRTVICATLASTSTAAQINSAIASCPSGQVVSLGAGTFNLTTGITFGSTSNVTVRGQGANSTFLVFTGDNSCNGPGADVCIAGSNSSPGAEQNVCDWTAGYAQGSTVITLANCGTTAPAKGSLTNLKVGSLLILDQVDEATDTGNIWNCLANGPCSNNGSGGFVRNDGPGVGGIASRSQEQGVVVTAINGAIITVSPGLYMPNWRSGQAPQAYFANSYLTLDGIENVSIDNTNSPGNECVLMMNCVKCWVAGIRSIMGGRDHVEFLEAAHSVVRDSYFYQNKSHASVSYAIELNNAYDNLIENNICQQVTDSCPNNNGPSVGNVAGYNFGIDEAYGANGWMQASFYQHASGDEFYLWEGNIGTGYTADNVHGTHHFNTLFRNYLIGNNQSLCGGGPCTAQTIPIQLYASSRYFNIVGNVLGQAGYHNNYTCLGTASNCANGNKSIYTLGATGNGGTASSSITGFCLQPACTTHGDFDPQTYDYLMRWGNYDTVNATVQFNNSEVPSGIPQYSNPVPPSQLLPASFYLATKPSWFGSVPFPAIGPDVTNGNIPNLGGHANMNPAQACYANVMGGPAAGTGGLLAFDANSCYGVSGPSPAPPTSLSAVVH